MKQMRTLKTVAAVRADFERKGISIAQWARDHNVGRQLVYEILRGSPRRQCRRGESHRIAVLLGLKDGEIAESTRSLTVAAKRVA
jgi:gp16 family phage-associated protein